MTGVDQRGYIRPGIGHTVRSIGAYEADAIPANSRTMLTPRISSSMVTTPSPSQSPTHGVRPVDACPTFANAEGTVDIAQIIKGVENALNGCGLH